MTRELKNRITQLKKDMQNSPKKGAMPVHNDALKENVVRVFARSNLSCAEFCREMQMAPATLRSWKDFFTIPGTSGELIFKNKTSEKSKIVISKAETRESTIAKKRIKRKELKDKKLLEKKLEEENITIPIETIQKEEDNDEVQVTLNRAIDQIVPIVNVKGDYIPQKFRDMQSEWLKNNSPKKYNSTGELIS